MFWHLMGGWNGWPLKFFKTPKFLRYVCDPLQSHPQNFYLCTCMNIIIYGYIYVCSIYKCKYICTENNWNILQYYDLLYYTYFCFPFPPQYVIMYNPKKVIILLTKYILCNKLKLGKWGRSYSSLYKSIIPSLRKYKIAHFNISHLIY